jgi:hypothetical protein
MTALSMSLRLPILAALTMVLAQLLASCGGNLPNSAISRHLAGRYAGALTDSTAVATVIRDRGIRPPDLSSAEPILDQLRGELAKSDPTGAYAGITYDLTRGNRLGGDWIVHTPDDMWGRKASDLPPGHSDSLVRLVHDLVASAQRRVDIALLQPAPDGPFLDALRSALQSLAGRGRRITVRVPVPTRQRRCAGFPQGARRRRRHDTHRSQRRGLPLLCRDGGLRQLFLEPRQDHRRRWPRCTDRRPQPVGGGLPATGAGQ